MDKEKYKDTNNPVNPHKPFWVVWCASVIVSGKFETNTGAQEHAMAMVGKYDHKHQPFYIGQMVHEYTSVPAIKLLKEA